MTRGLVPGGPAKGRGSRRIRLLVFLVAALALLIAGRLCQLQVAQSGELQARARGQHQRRIEVAATRGAILDRHGRELAVSLATRCLYAHPRRVQSPDDAARLLAPILGLPRREILDRLQSDKPFVYVARFLDPSTVEALRGLNLPIGEGEPFDFLPSSKRYYPAGRSGVHVVGFANIDGIGVEGIEKHFDDRLRGDPQVYLAQQDGRCGRLREMMGRPAKRPEDIVLTLDLVLQHITERELDRAVEETGARTASVVLVDPTNGHILSLANRPTADPNHYGDAVPAGRLNRAVVYQYEPGSTFKIVPMAAALEGRKVRPDQRFDCEDGTFSFRGRRIRDVGQHGVLSAGEILARSSNIGMVKIASGLEPAELWAHFERFGFGVRTGIELPGEQSGSLKPAERWTEHSRASMAFGQEIGVTVLQMAAAFATVASDGVRQPPRVVLGRRDPDGRLHRFPAPAAERVISSRTARELQAMLEEVIADGTGRLAGVPGYRIAGKSGTAQKAVGGAYSETEFVASFGGFGPLRSPRLACLVVLDSPRGTRYQGGEVAAPVFGRIMAQALRHLRLPADGEHLALARPPAGAHARPAVRGGPAPAPRRSASR